MSEAERLLAPESEALPHGEREWPVVLDWWQRKTIEQGARAERAEDDTERLRAAARDLYNGLVAEHGHNEQHDAPWPACLPIHMAMNRYRAILAETAR